MVDAVPNPPPTVDPTILTTEQLLREVTNLRAIFEGQFDTLRERLAGMDRATELLGIGVNRVPSDVDKQITHLRELDEEKFRSIELQFRERDTRSERESRDNKVAVDAAFAAQKEAASEQNKSNTLAIDKSEKATAETLNKQADLFKSTTDALTQQHNDLKDRVGAIEQRSAGGTAALSNQRAVIASLIGFGLFILVIAGTIGSIIAAKH